MKPGGHLRENGCAGVGEEENQPIVNSCGECSVEADSEDFELRSKAC